MKAPAGRVILFVCAAVVLLTGITRPVFSYDANGKRDPFVALVTPEGQKIYPPGLDEETAGDLDSMQLQGIVYDPKQGSYAVINGEIAKEQGEVGGAKILKIEPEKVTVLIDGKVSELTIREHIKENEE